MNKRLIASLLIFFVVGIGLFYFYKKSLKLELKNLSKELKVGSILDIGVLMNNSSNVVKYKSDSLRIVADLYENKDLSPAIILLHGSSTKGRKLELNIILGQKLYEEGFTVLAIDSRGYGDSEDPPHLNVAEDFNFSNDVYTAIDFLISRTKIDTSAIYLFGHSFGGGVALKPFFEDPRVKKAILFGPPRRYSERFFGNDIADRESIIKRKVRDMQLSYNLNFDVYKEVIANQNIEEYLSKFQEVHKPVFFIDCEGEDKKDLMFLEKIYKKVSQPKEYWTVPGVDHYLNTAMFYTYPAYNKNVIDNFVSRVSDWLKK